MKAVQTIFDKIDEQIQNHTISHGQEPTIILLGRIQQVRFVSFLIDLDREEEEELISLIELGEDFIKYRGLKIVTVNAKYYIGASRGHLK